MPVSSLLIFLVTLATVAGVLFRPLRIPEYAWALIGASVLCITGLLPWRSGFNAIMEGKDVYLFLSGLMIASELARRAGLFDYLARWATRHARGSGLRLFLLVYAVGILITVFMSNDATVVVLTPAVLAVTRTAKIRQPLPYLYACAFVANAASFVLPISNPANLVVFGEHLPRLTTWLSRFLLPSVVTILATYVALWLSFLSPLSGTVESNIPQEPLSAEGRWAAWSLASMAVVMLGASALDHPLGWPTFWAGVLALAGTGIYRRRIPMDYLAEIHWSILPLVAGLFVVTASLERSGAVAFLSTWLTEISRQSETAAAWIAGLVTGLGCNVANNLPLGMLAGAVTRAGHPAQTVRDTILIGIDLGPNLSITGSLATFLWIAALRGEGIEVDAFKFFKTGIVVMLPALIASIGLSIMLANHH